MKKVTFNKKDGSISSTRTELGNVKFTKYADGKRGGITMKVGNITTRFNNKNQCIGVGIKMGKHTTYIGKNGSVTNQITAF